LKFLFAYNDLDKTKFPFQFYTNKDIDKLIHETESCFINELESGDRQKAMKRLRVPPLGDQQSPWTTFKVRQKERKRRNEKKEELK
jgi:hypothetical protein